MERGGVLILYSRPSERPCVNWAHWCCKFLRPAGDLFFFVLLAQRQANFAKNRYPPVGVFCNWICLFPHAVQILLPGLFCVASWPLVCRRARTDLNDPHAWNAIASCGCAKALGLIESLMTLGCEFSFVSSSCQWCLCGHSKNYCEIFRYAEMFLHCDSHRNVLHYMLLQLLGNMELRLSTNKWRYHLGFFLEIQKHRDPKSFWKTLAEVFSEPLLLQGTLTSHPTRHPTTLLRSIYVGATWNVRAYTRGFRPGGKNMNINNDIKININIQHQQKSRPHWSGVTTNYNPWNLHVSQTASQKKPFRAIFPPNMKLPRSSNTDPATKSVTQNLTAKLMKCSLQCVGFLQKWNFQCRRAPNTLGQKVWSLLSWSSLFVLLPFFTFLIFPFFFNLLFGTAQIFPSLIFHVLFCTFSACLFQLCFLLFPFLFLTFLFCSPFCGDSKTLWIKGFLTKLLLVAYKSYNWQMSCECLSKEKWLHVRLCLKFSSLSNFEVSRAKWFPQPNRSRN